MLVTLYKIDNLPFRFLGVNGFYMNTKNERFTAADSRCRQNLKNENFTLSFGRLHKKKCTKEREARVARLFYLSIHVVQC